MDKKTKAPMKPMINMAGMEMLEKHILSTTRPHHNKSHDELVWEEAKRYILSCIHQQFQVIP